MHVCHVPVTMAEHVMIRQLATAVPVHLVLLALTVRLGWTLAKMLIVDRMDGVSINTIVTHITVYVQKDMKVWLITVI